MHCQQDPSWTPYVPVKLAWTTTVFADIDVDFYDGFQYIYKILYA